MRDQLEAIGIRLPNYAVGNHKTTCPNCSAGRRNKTEPCLSVTISDDSAVFLCHHCGDKGGVKDARAVVPATQVAKTFKKPTHEAPEAVSDPIQKWFARRCITPDVILKNGIDYQQVWMPGCESGTTMGAILFPYYRDGEVVNIKYRSHDKRFRQVKDAEKIYYGLDNIKGEKTVFICEGEIDALSLQVAGYNNVVSVPDGAPAKIKDGVTPEEDKKFEYVWNCKDAFEDVTKIVIAVDNDGPGLVLAEELARRYGKHRCWRVTWPDSNDVACKDANEVLMTHGVQTLKECLEDAKPYPIKSLYTADYYEADNLRLYDGKKPEAYSTGWGVVDENFKIRLGELSVVTGSPGSGKSQFIDAMMVNLAENEGWTFGVCSFENPPEHHLKKLVELHGRQPFYEGPTQRISRPDLLKVHKWIRDHFYFIRADDESPTVDWILETAVAAVMRYGIKGLVIDPYNEIEHKREAGKTETEYVSQILGKIKRFAQSHGVHVWFVAHPAKPPRTADGKPHEFTLYDISGSSNWVNKADVGLVIHRIPNSDQVEIRCRKLRFRELGKGETATLRFDKVTGRYTAA